MGGGTAVLTDGDATAAHDDLRRRGASAIAASAGQLNEGTTSEDNPCQE
jgi:hypothetical protein